ncbi:unnamed protein product [Diatraea saccharalis]|uniref:Glutaredoxin domain-containing protein n=1 Tax=Diatraea saccharalis TaxID=40085 RepID=A0A9P0G1S9_9NEOP|nr:unnamed protein product [Diatraea saccharalis]
MGSSGSKIISSTKTMDPKVHKFIKSAITKDKVVIFSKTYCPYCKMAKEVFSKVNQPFEVVELDQQAQGDAIQDNLALMTGFRTVSNQNLQLNPLLSNNPVVLEFSKQNQNRE